MILTRQQIEQWAAALLGSGQRVIAPVDKDGQIEYRELSADAPGPTGLGNGLGKMSPKGAWFPRSEPIVRIRRDGRDVTLSDPEMRFVPTVLFGARPCDAAAPDVLSPLFGWDFRDVFYEERRKQLAIVTVACLGPVDAACFCTSVGVDPAGQKIGDVLLTPLDDGRFAVEANTDQGRSLIESAVGQAFLPVRGEANTQRSEEGQTRMSELGQTGMSELGQTGMSVLREVRDRSRRGVPVRFDVDGLPSALEKRFVDPMWERSARSCLACGTCAFACPTCHCFDIQDEMGAKEGIRQKNWDACALPLFTLHTSGHNPRNDQASRWRQRLSHKFRYYPQKFGKVLCTGCGRCLRLCPGGMDLLADLAELAPDSAGAASAADMAQRRLKPPLPVTSNQQPAAVPGILASSPSPNIYRPYLMRIAGLRDETPDVRTLRLEFADAKEGEAFDFRVGQFGLYGPPGEGESTFCIASASTRKGYIECTFREAGRVTRALRRLDVGDVVGFRGPYGNSFPVEAWKGKDLLFIAGGIALPPMRSVIQYVLDKRADYGDITIVYGARTWADHVYKDELAEWEKRDDLKLWLCIDWKAGNGGLVEGPAMEGWPALNMKEPGATGLDPSQRRWTGFVPQLVEAAKPSPANRVAVLCGPPVMIKFTLVSLKKLGYSPADVYTTLENRMKCGVGKCGRCNVGPVYICKEGPVFTAAQVEAMPAGEM